MALGDGIRRNIASVDPAERVSLRDALIELNRRFFPGSRTDPIPGGVSWWFKQDEIHQATHVHGGPEFLPWHRELVNRLEEMLRQINPGLSLHYWDWTQDPRAIPNGNLGGGRTGTLNLFTPGFMGYGGSSSAAIGEPWFNAGYYVPAAKFYREASGNPADPPRTVVRSVAGSPAASAGDNAIVTAVDYPTMRKLLENVHNAMHGFVNMGEQHVSFRDPFVFLLHSNVDRLFARWQLDPAHPERLDPNSVYGSEGSNAGLNNSIRPWSGAPPTTRPWASPENQQIAKNYKHPTVVSPPRYDMRMVVGGFGYEAGGWRVEMHPRFLADLTGDGRADIIGFGNGGVSVSLNKGDGTFQAPKLALSSFGYEAGGWRVGMHPRFLADLTGDGRADIVGFGNGGVSVSLNKGDGTFQAPKLVLSSFGYEAGGWRVEMHPRFLADLTGDGRADIIGFGNGGVSVSLNKGDGTFQAPKLALSSFGYEAGGWRVGMHPRFLADLTGDGRADIVGFGNGGVSVSLNNGDGTFQAPKLVLSSFGYEAGGWRVEMHPRFLADLTGDGRADIVGFGNGGVSVSLNKGDGTFQAPKLVLSSFGYEAGGWRVEMHPRFLADLTGDGLADIVGFGDAAVWVALNNGNGTFQGLQLAVGNFGYSAGGWRVERHPRFLADLTGDGRADILGFGNAGVWVSAT
jgi:Common central domain of tyrosinase/FG-GAP-like repeat